MTIYSTAAAYFNATTVRAVWRLLGEFEVFVGRDVVVKRLARDKVITSVMFAQSMMGKGAQPGPRELMRSGISMGSALYQQKFGQIAAIKQKLGKLVVPFEMPDEITLRVARLWGIFTENERCYSPIVQRLVPRSDLVSSRLVTLRKSGDYDGMQKLIDGLFESMCSLTRHRMLPHDPIPTNFCLYDGAVRLVDLGAVWGRRRSALGMLGSEELRAPYVGRNLAPWRKAITGNLDHGVSPEIDRIAANFEQRFAGFFSERNFRRLTAGPRPRGSPVPDVFPLTVPETQRRGIALLFGREARIRSSISP